MKIIEDCSAKEILTEKQRAGQYDRVTSVVTSQGNIKCDVFINCTGLVKRFLFEKDFERLLFFFVSFRFQWARELGYKSSPSVRIATQACGTFFSLI